MKTFGILALVYWTVLGLLALAMTGASIAGFTGSTVMVVTALIAVLAWGAMTGLIVRVWILSLAMVGGRDADRCLRWSKTLTLVYAILSVATTWLLAFGGFASCGPAFLAGFYHWGGVAGSLLGFAGRFLMPFVVGWTIPSSGHATRGGWVAPVVTGATVYGFLGVFWLVAWLVLRGDIDESLYPNRTSSPFLLPWPGGESAWVVQGNASSFNHDARERFSWDFRRSCGTPVLAARAGTVTDVVDTNSGRGANNLIAVDHGDGTTARYLHIATGSAKVTPGTAVAQGDQLAEVGSVGNSMTGHIHFVVEDAARQSLPVTFRDVTEDAGIPRTFGSYTSGNR